MKLRYYIISIVCIWGLMSCNSYQLLLKDQSHSVSVNDNNRHIVAHIMVGSKKIKIHNDLCYYGFKRGQIFKTRGEVHGTALQGVYEEEYKDGELMEKGSFHQGLKHGIWRKWYSNGELKSIYNYHHGRKTKKYFHYDLNGEVSKKGKYFRDHKIGKEYTFSSNGEETKKYKLNGIEKVKKQPEDTLSTSEAN